MAPVAAVHALPHDTGYVRELGQLMGEFEGNLHAIDGMADIASASQTDSSPIADANPGISAIKGLLEDPRAVASAR